MDVLCLGIMTCDILVKAATEHILDYDTTIAQSISLDVGGDALNVALNLSKMGISSGVCGRIGTDSYGGIIKNTAAREGVNVSYLYEDSAHASSTSIVLIAPDGKRNFIFYPGATAAFSFGDVCQETLNSIQVLAVGSYFALPSFTPDGMEILLRDVKEKGILTVLDVTNNPQSRDLPVLKRFLPYVDYFIPSYEEAAAISDLKDPVEIAGFFRNLGALTVIIKMGKKGAVGVGEGGKEYVPATPDKPVDTTGAGDCFVAGIIAAVLKGFSLRESMIFACKAAGLSVTRIGAASATVHFDKINSRYKNFGIQEEQVIEDYYNNV